MTEDEIEVVAQELAKAGGLTWHPGRERGPMLKVVSDRYRDRARLAIAALERYRAQKAGTVSLGSIAAQPVEAPSGASANSNALEDTIWVGATVVYRPAGERRAYPCRIEKVEGSRAYLMPSLEAWAGWVPIDRLASISSEEDVDRKTH